MNELLSFGHSQPKDSGCCTLKGGEGRGDNDIFEIGDYVEGRCRQRTSYWMSRDTLADRIPGHHGRVRVDGGRGSI